MRKLPNSLSPFVAFLARHSAIVALAAFAIVGVAVLDDYGVAIDEASQRNNGIASLDYILGAVGEDVFADLATDVDRYYGVAFELPLIVVERLLRLEDSRDIFLSRHLITHIFFLVGGFSAWLLAYRLFGSRLIALLAMLLFLLHPRIYAHSFFNSKDVPFLSMFIIALYLTHRAFRRDSVLGLRPLWRRRGTARQHSHYGRDADSRRLGNVGAGCLLCHETRGGGGKTCYNQYMRVFHNLRRDALRRLALDVARPSRHNGCAGGAVRTPHA